MEQKDRLAKSNELLRRIEADNRESVDNIFKQMRMPRWSILGEPPQSLNYFATPTPKPIDVVTKERL